MPEVVSEGANTARSGTPDGWKCQVERPHIKGLSPFIGTSPGLQPVLKNQELLIIRYWLYQAAV